MTNYFLYTYSFSFFHFLLVSHRLHNDHFAAGAYGTVYKAQDLKTEEIVAMKKVRIALTEDGVPMSVLREISLLRHLGKYNHPNIVRLIDICHGPRYDREMVLYLVFEHVDQGSAFYFGDFFVYCLYFFKGDNSV
jgi:serine/threonine protein kinase